MKISPLNNNVLIEIEKQPEVTRSGIIIATRENLITEKGIVIASSSKIVMSGDVIYFKAYSLSPIEVNDKKYHFIKADDILAVQK